MSAPAATPAMMPAQRAPLQVRPRDASSWTPRPLTQRLDGRPPADVERLERCVLQRGDRPKVCYSSEAHALTRLLVARARAAAEARPRMPRSVYPCPDTGHWHLTSWTHLPGSVLAVAPAPSASFGRPELTP